MNWISSGAVTTHLYLTLASVLFASEPVVVTNAVGQPHGVRNVNVGGKVYDVDFVWGSFSETYGDPLVNPAFWREPNDAMAAAEMYGQSLQRWSEDGWPTNVFDGSAKSAITFSPVEITADGTVLGVTHFWGGQWYGSLETCEGLPDQLFSCPPNEWPDVMYAQYSIAVPESSGLTFTIFGVMFVLWVLQRKPVRVHDPIVYQPH